MRVLAACSIKETATGRRSSQDNNESFSLLIGNKITFQGVYVTDALGRASRQKTAAHVRNGSWLCKNVSLRGLDRIDVSPDCDWGHASR
jgi:hypothetical protein